MCKVKSKTVSMVLCAKNKHNKTGRLGVKYGEDFENRIHTHNCVIMNALNWTLEYVARTTPSLL